MMELLINSLLSNLDNDIHYMQYTSVKNPGSHKGLLWTKYNHKYYQINIHHIKCTIYYLINHKKSYSESRI